MKRELTGRHVLIIAVLAFTTVVGANLAMLFAATGSFPGLVVKSAYVEGQGWNDRTAAQEALGLISDVQYEPGRLIVTFRDAAAQPVQVPDLSIKVGRPATDLEDRILEPTRDGSPIFAIDLAPGQWQIDMTAPETGYRSTASLYVPERG